MTAYTSLVAIAIWHLVKCMTQTLTGALCQKKSQIIDFSVLIKWQNLIDIFSWTQLPDMPTGRHASGAVYVPSLGALVIGGYSEGYLRTAELLQTELIDCESLWVWKSIDPMIKGRWEPSAIYFDGNVIVTSKWEDTVEILPISDGHLGQWTLLSRCNTPTNFSNSLCVFNGRILLSG